MKESGLVPLFLFEQIFKTANTATEYRENTV